MKTLSLSDAYTDNQTGEPNAAANARQKRVNLDYHAKARRLDNTAAMGAKASKPGPAPSATTEWSSGRSLVRLATTRTKNSNSN